MKNFKNIFLCTLLIMPTIQASYLPNMDISNYASQLLAYLIKHPLKSFQELNKQYGDVKLHEQKNNAFSSDFQWGVGTSSSQIEEGLSNGWSAKYMQKHNISDLVPVGINCHSYSCWMDDIEKVEYLGCNSYRFSIEWSRVEPRQGQFDTAVLEHYKQQCITLRNKSIKPIVCLHHYSDPIWFLDKGGFTQEENLTDFINYCNKVYEYLHDYVDSWIVISQPIAYAIKGYKVGSQAPFCKNSGLESKVALNLLKAHCNVYDSFHEKTTKNIEIGICHQIVNMRTYHSWNPLEKIVAYAADRIYNQSLLEYFKTGRFQWMTPGVTISHNPDAPKKFDFFALSYYSPLYFANTKPTQIPVAEQFKTDDDHRVISPEGLKEAIKQAASLGKPVCVVENGINTKDEKKRKFFIQSQLETIAQARLEGHNVTGYYIWTLMDNYEWGHHLDATSYGLFHNRTDVNGLLKHNFNNHQVFLKDSGNFYKQVIAHQK